MNVEVDYFGGAESYVEIPHAAFASDLKRLGFDPETLLRKYPGMVCYLQLFPVLRDQVVMSGRVYSICKEGLGRSIRFENGWLYMHQVPLTPIPALIGPNQAGKVRMESVDDRDLYSLQTH